MIILFSVHNEDFETEESKLIYTKTVETNMPIAEIDALLQLYDGFHSVLEVGQNICFWDIYCYFENTDELQEKISSIPMDKVEPKEFILPKVLVIKEFDPESPESAFYPDENSCFAYRLTRYELGASSYEAIVMFASNHPWLMVFIGGAMWDITKLLYSTFIKLIKRKTNVVNYRGSQKKTVCFSVRKCYRNFSHMTKIPEEDCQIVSLRRRYNNSFDVRIRTINNQCFSVRCTCKGKIVTIKPIDIRMWHKEKL